MANILIIDDEPLVLELVTAALRLDGHEVTSFGDPLAAFQYPIPVQARFELLLTDVDMKPITGFEVVNRLRGNGFTGAVIFMSGYPSLGNAFGGPADEFAVIDKPFTVGQLRATIDEALSGSKSHHAI